MVVFITNRHSFINPKHMNIVGRRKKIILVSNTAWSIYNFRKGLVNALLSNGYEVIIVAEADKYVKDIIAEGWHFVPLKHIDRFGSNPICDLQFAAELRYIYQRIQPDFIIHYTIKPNVYGGFVAWQLGIKNLMLVTGLGRVFSDNNNFSSRIAQYLYGAICRVATDVWFLNEDDKQLFLQKNYVQPQQAGLLHSEGIDTEYFKPQNIDNQVFTFLLIARLLKDKGIGEYIEAARRMKAEGIAVEFQVLGFFEAENPHFVSKQLLTSALEARTISYLGETEDVRPYIAAADCIVLPTFYKEGVPRCLLEAAAMAKPIVATDVSGCRDVVEDKINGLLCAPRDINDLVTKLKLMYSMPLVERTRMGAAGRERVVARFSEEFIIACYLAFLKNALQNGA